MQARGLLLSDRIAGREGRDWLIVGVRNGDRGSAGGRMFKRKLRQDEDVYAREYASGADAFGEGIDDYDETSSSEDDSVEGEDAPTADLEETTDAPAPGAGGKIKVMILASRGINAR